jgi:hypothetical protein
MAKKKKKLKDDAWMWISQPSVPGISTSPVPGMVTNPFFKYSFTAPLPTPGGTAAEEGRSWGTDVPYGEPSGSRGGFDAWKYYAGAGLLDPKIPIEAYYWSGLLGISRLGGYAVALAVGVVIVGTVLTIIDPKHKWEGGLDESQLYKDTAGEFEYGFKLGWSQSPANPSNW